MAVAALKIPNPPKNNEIGFYAVDCLQMFFINS